MNPLAPLVEEHRLIQATIAAITALIDGARRDRPISPAPFLLFQEFIRVFADRAHHAKEEDVLFREMVLAGLPDDSGPIPVMVAEHERAREHCRAMGEAARACAAGQLHQQTRMLEAAAAYCRLLDAHIEKEKLILYPMALQLVGADRLAALGPLFEKVDRSTVGEFTQSAQGVIRAARQAQHTSDIAASGTTA